MKNDEGQVKRLEENIFYLQKYIQKQEQLLLGNIRKNLEYDIKMESLNSSITDLSSKYEESQKQVDIQNEMMQQAANGLEAATLEKEKLKTQIFNLENMISNKKRDYDELNKRLMDFRNESNVCKEEREIIKKELSELKSEYIRQTEELNILFKENEELKKGKLKIKETQKSVDEF